MSRKQNIEYNILEIIKILSRSKTSDWVTALTKTKWKGSDDFKYDIRSWNIDYLNEGNNFIDTSNGFVRAFGKGITLNDEEYNNLININKDNNEFEEESIIEINQIPDTKEERVNKLLGMNTLMISNKREILTRREF